MPNADGLIIGAASFAAGIALCAIAGFSSFRRRARKGWSPANSARSALGGAASVLRPRRLHHVAVICSDYAASKRFYTEVLGFELLSEHYREARSSWKADLALNGTYVVELFSFPDPPPRVTGPEARGLRHLSLLVDDADEAARSLAAAGVEVEPVRVDEHTGKRFAFFKDPDGLPIEVYGA